MKFFKYLLFLLAVVFCGALFIYWKGPTVEARKTVMPKFSTSIACGNVSASMAASRILDTSSPLKPSGQEALRENTSAIPSHVTELLEKKGFKIAAKKSDLLPKVCQYTSESIPGRAQLCLDLENKKIAVVLRDDEKEKYSESSQIGEALLPGIFSLVYDHFWRLPEDERLARLVDSAKSGTFDASERPLSEYQKFNFWRYSVISTLFLKSDLPFRDFEGSGTLSPLFVKRTLNLFSSDYYCRPDSHRKFQDTQPSFYKEFSSSLACILGKPWFMKDADYQSSCSTVL